MSDEIKTFNVFGVDYTKDELSAMTGMFAGAGWAAMCKAAANDNDENIKKTMYGKPVPYEDYLAAHGELQSTLRLFAEFPAEVQHALESSQKDT